MAFIKISTEHFWVFYEPSDQKFVEDIKITIDNFYNKVVNDVSLPGGKKFDLYVCPNVENYMELTGKTKESYQDWMVGWTDFNLNKVCILSPRVAKDRTYEDIKKVICHEIVHIVFDSLGNSDDTELWLSEGIATLYADQIEPEYIDKQNFPLIKDLSGEDNFVDNGGYDYCGIYVWYFIREYGIDCYKNVYMGKECVDKYLFSTFEKDAVNSFIMQNK